MTELLISYGRSLQGLWLVETLNLKNLHLTKLMLKVLKLRNSKNNNNRNFKLKRLIYQGMRPIRRLLRSTLHIDQHYNIVRSRLSLLKGEVSSKRLYWMKSFQITSWLRTLVKKILSIVGLEILNRETIPQVTKIQAKIFYRSIRHTDRCLLHTSGIVPSTPVMQSPCRLILVPTLSVAPLNSNQPLNPKENKFKTQTWWLANLPITKLSALKILL